MSDWSVKAVMIDVFWQRIETAIGNWSDCDICPVNEYAHETNTERICDKVADCADGLKLLHKKLEEEENNECCITCQHLFKLYDAYCCGYRIGIIENPCIDCCMWYSEMKERDSDGRE